MPHEGWADVKLIDIDDDVLDELVAVALADAAPDEVTPPLTAGSAWTATRVEWLRAVHVDRRQGLAGPAGELTWAILVDGHVVGAVRLRRVDDGVFETGIWLARRTRGRGVGRTAIGLVADMATRLGATELRAETIGTNAAALAVLTGRGFSVAGSAGNEIVRASLAFNRPGPI